MIDLFGKKAKINEQRETNKKFLMYENVICYIALISFFTLILAAAYATEILAWQIAMIAISIVLLIIAVIFGIKIETEAGFYECAKCNHRHVPKYSSVLSAPHIGRTRYMRCPKCEEKSWQKKRLTEKED